MRSTPNAVTYGALQYGGLGLRHLYVERGIAQLILVIRHVRAMSDQGVMCLIAVGPTSTYTANLSRTK